MTTTSLSSSSAAAQAPGVQVTLRTYGVVTLVLSVFFAGIAWLASWGSGRTASPSAILAPLVSQVALVGAVWLVMVVFRNYAIIREIARADHYLAYRADPPPDWVERPARTFDNLMQVPILFYVACILMLVTERLDAAQVALSWVFVATRIAHAVIYMGWNYLPARFGTYVAGFVTLMVIFSRFAMQSMELVSG